MSDAPRVWARRTTVAPEAGDAARRAVSDALSRVAVPAGVRVAVSDSRHIDGSDPQPGIVASVIHGVPPDAKNSDEWAVALRDAMDEATKPFKTTTTE